MRFAPSAQRLRGDRMFFSLAVHYPFMKPVLFHPGSDPDQVRHHEGPPALPEASLHGWCDVPHLCFFVQLVRGPLTEMAGPGGPGFRGFHRQAWMVETLLLYRLYFWLMAKFDDGVIFWTLPLLGLPLLWYV